MLTFKSPWFSSSKADNYTCYNWKYRVYISDTLYILNVWMFVSEWCAGENLVLPKPFPCSAVHFRCLRNKNQIGKRNKYKIQTKAAMTLSWLHRVRCLKNVLPIGFNWSLIGFLQTTNLFAISCMLLLGRCNWYWEESRASLLFRTLI